MNTPVREGETLEGSRTMRNRPYPVLKCSKRRISALQSRAAGISMKSNEESWACRLNTRCRCTSFQSTPRAPSVLGTMPGASGTPRRRPRSAVDFQGGGRGGLLGMPHVGLQGHPCARLLRADVDCHFSGAGDHIRELCSLAISCMVSASPSSLSPPLGLPLCGTLAITPKDAGVCACSIPAKGRIRSLCPHPPHSCHGRVL